ncbi:hypothetical protein [Actinacidiphila acididurans]|uniref:Uncharacterized protein n=1 Tax=Actinacidiphila acididurans TaxID=2784346 RepID=A0ABS2TZP1_9ACTN|nr:hypothetical protein [Actinacidiphila acididurans]MBM9508542.1 hypothetical protein [Actinacidiphila acididurans]
MVSRREILVRGVRFGVRLGRVGAVVWGALALALGLDSVAAGAVMGDVRGGISDAVWCDAWLVVGALGTLAVAVLIGAAVATVLAVVPEGLLRHAIPRGLLAAFPAAVMWFGEVGIVAVITDVGYGPVLLTVLLTLVPAITAAWCSAALVGLSDEHAWLRKPVPNPVLLLYGFLSRPGLWWPVTRRALKSLW